MLQWHWITHPYELQRWWQRAPRWIGLDTEFIRERTYWPQLALVQIAIAHDVLLVDCQSVGMPEAIKPWLTAPELLKIMHSAGEDCVAFQHACQATPAPLFDTQLAATLCGCDHSISYQKLVAQITGVQLCKGETRSNWQHRPLSQAQLHYAADDVRYLHDLYVALQSQLEAQHRLSWLQEDCERLVTLAKQEGDGRWSQLDGRVARGLDPTAQRRLARIGRWREQHARTVNKPRNWILSNALLHQLAQSPPSDLNALQHALKMHPKAVQQLAEPIWQALSTPPTNESPTAVALIDRQDHTQTLKRLQNIVAQHSQVLGIPQTFLASRRHLETLIHTRAWPSALGQWRRDLLEKPLLQVLTEESSV